MLNLNTAILNYVDLKKDISGITNKCRSTVKKRIKRCEKRIKTFEFELIKRYPQFKRIIVDHISGSMNELIKERNDFFDYINDGEMHKFAEKMKLNEEEKEFLRKITFMTFSLGRNKAIWALNKIMGNKPNFRRSFEQEMDNIHKYTDLMGKDRPHMRNDIEKYIKENIELSQETYECKLEKLHRPLEARMDDKAIVNLTDVRIPEDILMGLSFGPKFCFPVNRDLDASIMFIDYFIEHLELDFPIETHFEAYKQLSIEMNRENRSEKTVRNIWLDLINYRIKKFRAHNPNLCITRSDKGKHTVIMLNDEYIRKMNDLIISTDDYVLINSVNVQYLEERNNNFVSNLLGGNALLDEQCLDSCTTISQMYGLVKIHKKNFPVRPITSACASPGFKLAKYFTKVLSEVFHEDGFHVRNSLQFVDGLKEIPICENEVLVSFDVVSMFTNIPVDHMIILISERKDEIESKFRIKFELFREILLFLLKECAIFSWNKDFYRQKDSLAMGSPLSPILAKILMTKIIKFTLSKIPIAPRTLALYVDDSFWRIEKEYVNLVLQTLNSYHHKIKFTVEMEKDNSINFLDVTIIRCSDKLTYRWYRKTYASSRLINYFSGHEKGCILETAKAYVRMVFALSDCSFFNENKKILEDILRRNSFPELEIESILRENYTYMRPLPKSGGFEGKYVPIKYNGGLTHRLKNKIHPFIPHARLVGVPDRSNSKNFSILKDPIDINEKSNVVIIFVCECKQQIIIRHTDYNCRAEKILSEFLVKYRVDGECSMSSHVFKKRSVKRCGNFSSVKRIFDMYAYAYKDKLVDTSFGLPQYYVSKQLNVALRNKN